MVQSNVDVATFDTKQCNTYYDNIHQKHSRTYLERPKQQTICAQIECRASIADAGCNDCDPD